MKKLILAAITTACAASVFAQGTVVFNNRVSGTYFTHIYGALAPGSTVSRIGNGPNDTPVGATDWAGFTLIGTTGGLNPSTTFAALLGAPGFGVAESSLVPASGGGVTSFRTGVASGQVAGTTATFGNIPQNAPQATLELVAWDNSSGLYGTWALASAAWKSGLIQAGTSGTWNQDNMGGTQPAPNLLNSTDPTQLARSFNLYFVPEPTSAALLGLGAAAMLIFRRRK
jgi:PEP-CTERM motif